MTTASPALPTPKYANGVDLLFALFLKMADHTLERSLIGRPDGFIVVFLMGMYAKHAVRIYRTETTVGVGLYRSRLDAETEEHLEYAILTMGFNLYPHHDSSVIEKARGAQSRQHFFVTPPRDGLGSLRSNSAGGLEFLIQFFQMIEEAPYDYVWAAEFMASWFAGMQLVRDTLGEAVPTASVV